MFSKYIRLFLLQILLAPMVFSQVNIYLKPSAIILFPESDNLSGYYGKENILTFGGEVDLITDYYGIGAYVLVTYYSVDISDENQIGSTWNEKSTIISFGLLKNFNFDIFQFNAKAGISVHNDDLALGENNARYGFRIGADFSKMISQNVGVFLGLDYDYNKLSVPSYMTFAYSRHNAFFSGKTLSTGGIFLNAGITIQLF